MNNQGPELDKLERYAKAIRADLGVDSVMILCSRELTNSYTDHLVITEGNLHAAFGLLRETAIKREAELRQQVGGQGE